MAESSVTFDYTPVTGTHPNSYVMPWRVPQGVSHVKIECVGAGGKGGPYGGGGGAYCMTDATVLAGTDLWVMVNSGHGGYTVTGVERSSRVLRVLDLTNTYLTDMTYCLAPSAPTYGQTGASVLDAVAKGDVKISGGNGGLGYNQIGDPSIFCGGGGGGAGGAHGGDAFLSGGIDYGGTGGQGLAGGYHGSWGLTGGRGGRGGSEGNYGETGINPGGGAGGFGRNPVGPEDPTGGLGRVVLTWTVPQSSVPMYCVVA